MPSTTPLFRHLWGGAVHRVVALDPQRAWTSEDGGRIRHTIDGGTNWGFQTTPDSARGTLLGAFFLADGLHGWAVSDDGLVLSTTTGGEGGWQQLGPGPIQDPKSPGARAELFDIFFADEQRGWLAGLHLLRRTTDGGQTWSDVQLLDEHGAPLDTRDLEIYSFTFRFSGGQLIGLASAEPGIILRTSDAQGATWKVVLSIDDPGTLVPGCFADEALEIWDVAFVPGTPFDHALAYACSGVGNGCGYLFSSKNGGRTWAAEPYASGPTTPYRRANALYGVSAFADGGAIAYGYGSQVLVREPGQSVWVDMTDTHTLGTQPMFSVACDPAASGARSAFAVGEFGALRRTKNRGKTWVDLVQAPAWRLRTIAFPGGAASGLRGWVAGQQLRIAKTSDGGMTWVEQRAEPLGSPDFGRNLRSLSMASETRGVAVGGVSSATNKPAVFFTTEGGDNGSWLAAELPASVPGFELRKASFAGTNAAQLPVFWAVGPGGLALRSVDGGASWTIVPLVLAGEPLPPNLNGISFQNLASGYAVGVHADGRAAALRIDGADGANPTWTSVAPLVRGELLGVSVDRTSGTAYAVGRGGLLWRKGTNDAQFAPVSAASALIPAGTDLFGVEVVPGASRPAVFACGSRGLVLQLAADTWSAPRSQTSLTLLELSLPSGTRGYAVGGLVEGTAAVVGFSALPLAPP